MASVSREERAGTRRLYGAPRSGHVHRVAALLSLLDLPYTLELVDAERRATPAFRAMNPFGQIPVLDDDGLVLADSNAILVYLARRYDPADRWLPRDPVGEAKVQRWLSVAAGEIAFGPARARAVKAYGRTGIDYPAAVALSERILSLLDAHLGERRRAGADWMALDRPTIADLALYAYVKAAPEGEVALAPYPEVLGWLGRLEAIEGFPPFPLPG